MNNRLNEVAMEIILHSGNGRNKIHSAMKLAIEDLNYSNRDEVNGLFNQAKSDINKAHNVHTAFMQDTLEDDICPNILFSHAQDTLMTIISEQNLIRHLINLKYSMEEITDGKK